MFNKKFNDKMLKYVKSKFIMKLPMFTFKNKREKFIKHCENISENPKDQINIEQKITAPHTKPVVFYFFSLWMLEL